MILQADGTFLMYYSAVYKENKSVHCISAATSTNIQGPYTPIDNVLACPVRYASESCSTIQAPNTT